ncbi:MAG: helix-turn-helix transcriptional regulator [Anditalea sp.]
MRAELLNRINKKIATIAAVADDLPCVIIIHNVHDFSTSYMSQRGLDELSMTLKELQGMSIKEYHENFFNPDDAKDYLPKIVDLLKRNTDESITLFQQVRVSEKKEWRWHMSSIKILMRNDEGKPLLMITLSYPIDPLSHVTTKVSRILEENNFLRKNNKAFTSLTKKEVEVLRLTALGDNSTEMAEKLHISEKTATTHRRNIRAKLKIQSNYDITCFAHAFDLI